MDQSSSMCINVILLIQFIYRDLSKHFNEQKKCYIPGINCVGVNITWIFMTILFGFIYCAISCNLETNHCKKNKLQVVQEYIWTTLESWQKKKNKIDHQHKASVAYHWPKLSRTLKERTTDLESICNKL